MRQIGIVHIAKFILYLLLVLVEMSSAFGQKDGKYGTLQITQRNGTIRELALASGITIRNIKCDSLLIDSTWFNDILQISPNPCEPLISTIVESAQHSYSKPLQLSIHPNPASGTIRLVIQSRVNETVNVQVINLLGQVVYQFVPFQSNYEPKEIFWDTKQSENVVIHSGIYFIRAITNNTTVTQLIEIL